MTTNRKNTLEWLWKVSGKTKWNILVLLIVHAFLGISSILYALSLKEIINAAISGNSDLFFRQIFLFALLIAIQLGLRSLRRHFHEATRSTLENRFKDYLLNQCLHQDFSYVTTVHTGEWMNRLTNDVVIISDGMTEILPNVTGMLVILIGAISMIVVLEPRFLYLLVPGGIILLYTSTLFRKHMKKLHKRIQEEDGKLRILLQEILEGLLVIRTYGVEEEMEEQAKKQMDAHRNARMRRNHFSNISNIGFGFIMNGAYVLGAFFCGQAILNGSMNYGSFTAILQLINQIQSPFANIFGYLPRYYALLASAERLMEVEKRKNEFVERKSEEELQKLYQDSFVGIGLKNATFTYLPPVNTQEDINMPVVISSLDLEINKGEFVAFTGASGCGKSTVLKLLMCLYPLDSGKRYIRLDNEERNLDDNWKDLFAYVPQGNFLMSGTIREIICFANKKAINDEERINNSLKIACADFVFDLEKGVDTILGERGSGLSEGQMQRLAIARAIFSNRPILMLDEATSALDSKTEIDLLNNLRALTDKTVLIITHREAVCSYCDRELHFDNKGISEVKLNESTSI